MSKLTSVYICQQCGFRSSQYLGKCPQCDSWNSLVEEVGISAKGKVQSAKLDRKKAEIVELSKLKKADYKRITTGLDEFDRCLGGGIVPGSLVLVSGDPGIGKSTLLTQLALNVSGNVLYIAGEESAQQIKLRADRIKLGANLAILNETDVDLIAEVCKQIKPIIVIIDSIQTLQTQDLNGAAGTVGQVRECAYRLQKVGKYEHTPIFLVGHVTKDGSLAGPKTLEHLVDVVLSIEGDPTSQFRILRSSKNRFGPTDEIGVFEMEDKGMVEVKNPSKMFLEQKVDAPGSSVVAVLSGIRPLLVEIQALVTKTSLPLPRRTGSGVDNNRLQLLCAVLQKRLGLPLFDQDIFVNVTGGLKIFEPAADLGICLAIISSFKDKTIKSETIFVGEVGLLGEVRNVRQLDKRVTEAKKLGYTNVVTPENVKSLTQAIEIALV